MKLGCKFHSYQENQRQAVRQPRVISCDYTTGQEGLFDQQEMRLQGFSSLRSERGPCRLWTRWTSVQMIPRQPPDSFRGASQTHSVFTHAKVCFTRLLLSNGKFQPKGNHRQAVWQPRVWYHLTTSQVKRGCSTNRKWGYKVSLLFEVRGARAGCERDEHLSKWFLGNHLTAVWTRIRFKLFPKESGQVSPTECCLPLYLVASIFSTTLWATFANDQKFQAMQGADSTELGHWTFQANASGFVLNLFTRGFCDFSHDFSNTLRSSVVWLQEKLISHQEICKFHSSKDARAGCEWDGHSAQAIRS